MNRHPWLGCIVGAWLASSAPVLAACISDIDGDGVCDNVDLCPNTVPGAPVDADGCPPVIPGDYDRDGDVGPDDFAYLAACLSGPDLAAGPACQAGEFDYDFDTDLDLADFAAFQRCFSGENQPASPDCASHQAYIQDGCLHIIGTAAGTVLALRLQIGGPAILEIDVENDGSVDFAFDRGQFECIVINAGSGDDTVWIDEQFGVFTDAEVTTIYGGTGHDLLLGGSGPETFHGGPGNDDAFVGAGDDRFIWESGDDTDFIEDVAGFDAVEVHGDDDAEEFTVTANGTRVRFDRISPAPSFLDIGGCESLVLRANGGDDALSCTGNLAALIQVAVDGGGGRDVLLGSNGVDLLLGGDDNDFIDGNQGNDVAFLGAGDDVFQWDPGDGSDTVEGQAGADTLRFNGSAANETMALSANGARLRLTRDVASIVMDLNDVEQVDVNALGGTDAITVNDLAGTDATLVSVDLATFGGIGDGQADAVSIVGTPAADVFNISADVGLVVVDLAADVRVMGYEASDQVVVNGVGGDIVNVNGSAGADAITLTANGTQARVDATGYSAAVAVSGALSLTINGLGGPDTLSCMGNLAGLAIPFTLDGGAGDDTVLGSNAADVLIGGDDDDLVDGNQGNDVAFLGAGDDVFQWDPGDGSDAVEGQAGADILRFHGSAANEMIALSANGARLRLTRDVASIVMDLNDVEQVDVNALGGMDAITVNDLAGTDAAAVNVGLASMLGGGAGDGQPDTVTVVASNGSDAVAVTGSGTAALVAGLSATVNVTTAEAAIDRLNVNAQGGNDTVDASGLASGVIGLTLNGGSGNDVLTGSHGSDVLNGDDDNDRFVWNSDDGTDVVEGHNGVDILEVNGGDGAESFTITANGTRVRFDRLNPAPAFIDIGTCESLVLNANGGNDSLSCSGNLAALIQITADGGAGDDSLLGSNGADILIGGDDDDFVDGNQGNDAAFLGAGEDVFQWDPGDGSDTVEGQAGDDTLLFNGSAIGELFDLSSNGARLRITRNVGSIVMDLNAVEQCDLHALGGPDAVTVNDLSGTDVLDVNIDLAGTLGGGTGDAQPDAITVNGTESADTINITVNSGTVMVAGLSATTRVTHSEQANDLLTVNGLGGVDAIAVGPGVTALIMLVINP